MTGTNPNAAASAGSLPLQATTGAAGFALQNGTPTILSWTAPNDGNMHRAVCSVTQHVTSGETGGAVQVAFTTPDGTATTTALFAGGAGIGGKSAVPADVLVQAGSVVSVAQSSALTVGATVLWAEIWAA